MHIGFGKADITPRLGVELYGYSGYLNRHATAVRDRLYARSFAVSDGDCTAVVISCDLVFVPASLTAEVRHRVAQATGLDPAWIMLHATHTHSGPCLRVDYRSAYDPPYMELLPRRIARAAVAAVNALQEAELHHACVPCEGMGTNRVYDNFNYGLDALREGFRPRRPELTDTCCHVLTATAGGRLLGFVSYFGCHNVVGGPGCTYIHGDYAGIATGMLERENPGAIGVFLQGAEGDVNTAGCCFGNDQVLAALDALASRYARAVRHGMAVAEPLAPGPVRVARREATFSKLALSLDELRQRLATEQAVIDKPDADDADEGFRWAVLRAAALRDLVARTEAGNSFETTTDIQGIRVGPVALLGAPMEVFQAIKNEIVSKARLPIPLVLSVTNDEQGYAVDRQAAQNEADYAARTVPLWKHTMPYADIHGELVAELLKLEADLLSVI